MKAHSYFAEIIWTALDSLRAHKVRSALTVLGIVVGVTSVISVAAIIDGLNNHIRARGEAFGSQTYIITRVPGYRAGRLSQKMRLRKYFRYTDAEHLRAAVPSALNITTFATRTFLFGYSNQVRYNGSLVDNVVLRGVEPQYTDAIPLFTVARGRFINDFDEDHARPVIVLGAEIANSLFPHVDPLGKTVRVNGKLYEVIGVFESDSGLFGTVGVDQFACIPLSNFRKNYPEAREFGIAFALPANGDASRTMNEMVAAVRRLRAVPHYADNDFELRTPDFLSNLWGDLTSALVVLSAIVSSIGLLIGGVGLMNIMIISVTERTREIGVRKAIGARRADIRLQFLLEAVTLTLFGGILGTLVGAAVSWTIRALVPTVPADLSAIWVVLGVAMSAAVGLFFGYYPANRAANLDPIACLRYE